MCLYLVLLFVFHVLLLCIDWSLLVLVLKTSLTPPLFIEVPVPCQERERSCICVSGIDFASFNDFSIRFWNCSDSVALFVFHFIVGEHCGRLYRQMGSSTGVS